MARGEATIKMKLRVKGATILPPAKCEAGHTAVALGTQLTIIDDKERVLHVNPPWECRLDEGKLVLLDTQVQPPKRADCLDIRNLAIWQAFPYIGEHLERSGFFERFDKKHFGCRAVRK